MLLIEEQIVLIGSYETLSRLHCKLLQRIEMTKVKYIGNGMLSSGIHFMKGTEYELTEEVAEYIIKRFGKDFEVAEKPKPTKTKAKEKPKAD